MTNKVFNPKDYEKPGLVEEEIIEIKECFDLFDADKTGEIDPNELKNCMNCLGLSGKSDTINKMLEDIDINKDGKIDFSEFLDLMTAKMTERDSKDDIKKVFKLFDSEGKGFIDISCLRRVAKELGENMDENELNEMIDRADTDNDGALKV